MTAEMTTEHARHFHEIAEKRRSVRKFLDEPIPEEVVRECLEAALLAPNSSNLQTWYFRWVRTPELKARLAKACMGQQGAKSASDLIVVTTRVGMMREHCRWALEHYPVDEPPKIVRDYYTKLAPLMYGVGPLGILRR